MPVTNVCDDCGLEHALPDRTFDSETGRTRCPNCGACAFAVRRTGIEWHPP